jgi:glycogen operon protein
MQPSGRIDSHPTHEHKGFKLRAGKPYPLGATVVPGGVNFAIFSRYATDCTLILFEKGGSHPLVEIPFHPDHRVGNVYTVMVFDLEIEEIEYGFRMDGPFAPHQGHWFDPSKILLDPYARAINGRDIWNAPVDHDNPFQHRGLLIPEDYDWEEDRPLEIPIQDLVIYEMHVRGFTQHPSSGSRFAGTYSAIREKIPYLKELGVNCIELMPVFEFDEHEYDRINPLTNEKLINYWGYSSVGFFAPKSGYAATGPLGMQADEFKTLIKDLHRAGIEIILDVVFNHTAEGNELGETISFRGIDNKTYYMLAPDGRYMNFSGTGNTMNCNNPVVRNMVIDCLRYWVYEYHIDGFRFDLASILGRDQYGMPLANPPLIEHLAYDPVLARCKLIAEAWDAGGLYQVGSFPSYGRWAEWNGKYRDALRRFNKGDAGMVWEVAQRIQGSPDLYHGRGTGASINFITCHDGFSLMDLYSYNHKHNEANGEENRDGANDNHSWNCGVEGPTDDPGIKQTRRRLIKNAVAMLMVSQGVPMINMGDEIGHTKYGNNNTYCHDNALNWLDWAMVEQNADLFRFFQQMIAFRHAHPALRSRDHFQHRDHVSSGYPDISWHTTQAWAPDWGEHVRTLAFMLCGKHALGGTAHDDFIYVAMNMHWTGHNFQLPNLPRGQRWHLFADTNRPSPDDICVPGEEKLLRDQRLIPVEARSLVIALGR